MFLGIVGQTGSFGMVPTVQLSKIVSFRNRKTNLLVCTSVLDEGIDLKDCDFVFSVGARFSLIQKIQKRGRVRKSSGKFIVILSNEEKSHLDKLDAEELNLNSAVDAVAVKLEKYESEKDAYEPVVVQTVDFKTKWQRSENLTTVYDIPIRLYINAKEERIINQGLIEELVATGYISDVTFHTGGGQACVDSGCNSFCACDSVVYVSIMSSFKVEQFYNQFIKNWSFLIAGKTPVYLLYPAPSSSLLASEDTSDVIFDGVEDIAAGFFCNWTDCTFDPFKCNISTMNVKSGKSIVLSNAADDMAITIGISSLQSHLLVGVSKDKAKIMVCIFLKNAPKVHEGKAGSKRRVFLNPDDNSNSKTSEGVKLLQYLTNKPVIAISFSSTKLDSIIDFACKCKSQLGINAYFTRLNILAPLVNQSAKTTINNIGYGSNTQLVNDCLINFLVLQSMPYRLNANPNITSIIYDEIISAVNKLVGTSASESKTEVAEELVRINNSLEMVPLEVDRNEAVWMNLLQVYNAFKGLSTSVVLETMVSVYRIRITQSRVIFKPKQLVKSNRLLRKFSNLKFAYVSFRDEDDTKTYDDQLYSQRFAYFIKEGIVVPECSSVKFKFLLASASQQREQTAIFVLVNENDNIAEEIRNHLIPDYMEIFSTEFKNGTGVNFTKLMSRFGLFATTDNETGVSIDDYVEIADSYTGGPIKRILTDGAGLINEHLLNTFKETLSDLVGKNACALQFRAGGMKGVVLLDRTLANKFAFRPSNKKFKGCLLEDFCVVKSSTFVPLKLNRELLNLLCSMSGEGKHGGDWEPLPYLLELQEKELQSFAGMLISSDIAVSSLIAHGLSLSNKSVVELVNNQMEITVDPFWRNLLNALYIYTCKGLRTKSRISMENGARLFGVPDPCNVLNDNELRKKLAQNAVKTFKNCFKCWG